jgi:DnaJ domain
MGPLVIAGSRVEITGRARVKWCKMVREGVYRAGLYLDDVSSRSSERTNPVHAESSSGVDYYEVLEVSPKASPDTIHRVYRILAQRYHPDNADTGDEEAFKDLLTAYRVLSGPEERAAYDVQRVANRQTRWKIFEQVEASRGLDAEKRKRHGILSLLYIKRVNDPDQPGMTLYELEDLLGCPREHLSFSLWYLKENNYILRGDNGRVSITAQGVDQAEVPVPWNQREDRLLAPGPAKS